MKFQSGFISPGLIWIWFHHEQCRKVLWKYGGVIFLVEQKSSRRSNITTTSSTSSYIATFHRISCPDQCQAGHFLFIVNIFNSSFRFSVTDVERFFAVMSSFISCAAKQTNVFLSWFISDQSELLNNPIFMVGQVPMSCQLFLCQLVHLRNLHTGICHIQELNRLDHCPNQSFLIGCYSPFLAHCHYIWVVQNQFPYRCFP